jgi:hypothetical protein
MYVETDIKLLLVFCVFPNAVTDKLPVVYAITTTLFFCKKLDFDCTGQECFTSINFKGISFFLIKIFPVESLVSVYSHEVIIISRKFQVQYLAIVRLKSIDN